MSEEEYIEVSMSGKFYSGKIEAKICFYGYPYEITVDERGYFSLYYHKPKTEREYIAGCYIEKQEDFDKVWNLIYEISKQHHKYAMGVMPNRPDLWGTHKDGFAVSPKERGEVK